jgi:hypothetical protein
MFFNMYSLYCINIIIMLISVCFILCVLIRLVGELGIHISLQIKPPLIRNLKIRLTIISSQNLPRKSGKVCYVVQL